MEFPSNESRRKKAKQAPRSDPKTRKFSREDSDRVAVPRSAPSKFPEKGIEGMQTPESKYANPQLEEVKVKLPTVTPPTKDPSVSDIPDDDSIPSLSHSGKSGGYATPEESKSIYEDIYPETVSETSTQSSVPISKIPPPPHELEKLLQYMLTHFGDVPHLAPNGLPNLVKNTLGCETTNEPVETLKMNGETLVATYGQEGVRILTPYLVKIKLILDFTI